MSAHTPPAGILAESHRAIFDATVDAICVYDAGTGEILDTNRANCELHGLSADEIRARGAWGMSARRAPYTEARAAEYLARAAAGEALRFEWATVTRDGEEIVWDTQLTRAVLLGRPVLLGVARDIRERKAAEEALRRANEELERRVAERTEALAAANRELQAREERFRAIIENSSDVATILDADARVVFQSPAVTRVLGYDPMELVGRPALDLVHPDDVPGIVEVLTGLAADPDSTQWARYRYRHRDGSWRVLETVARRAGPAADAPLICNSRDVTERWEAERALEEREARFRRLTENSADMIQVVGPDTSILYTGPSVQRLLGYTPEEIAGTSAMAYLHPDDVALTVELFGRMLTAPGVPVDVSYRVWHKTERAWRWFEANAMTLSTDSVEHGVVVNARDVTRRKEAEEVMRRATEEAERANHAKSEFLSRMSHELRTPLNSILGFGQLLERVEMEPRDKRAVRHIVTAGEHLLRLINEVLDLARIEAGRQALSIEPVHLPTVLGEAVALMRPLGGAHGVRVADAPDAADGYVLADRQRLVQVLLNLLSNGVKYNRPGGSVSVRCDLSAGGRTRLRVDDTGMGIAAERRGELFTPFSRLGAEGSGIEGTGLGLALARRLVEAMGGSLQLESSSGEGSTFVVELETASAPAVFPEPAAGGDALAEPPTTAATLLYVEDNLANLNLVEQLIAYRPGWTLIPALQGRLGIELARQHTPDVVLLDLHLPDLHGEEVFRQLRADPRTAAIPVVVISADATPGSIARLRAAGVDGYLSKPLRIDEFLDTVDAAVAGLRS